MEHVRNHHYVISCSEAKPVITETIKFLYDLEQFNVNSVQVGITKSFGKILI